MEELNTAQMLAVKHREGPLVIYAGAGSGKTRVICHRICELIQNGISPSSILAVTFTNKSAKEMRERTEHLAGPRGKSVLVTTFHSACARFLRMYATEIGFTESFSIYDDGDQKSLIKDVLSEMNVSDKLLSSQTLKSRIDSLKNKGETPDIFLHRIRNEPSEKDFQRYGEQEADELVYKCYSLYQQKLLNQNAMDFNDLLMNIVLLLESSQLAKTQLQNRYRYFMVDEFQDTNPIQFKFLQLLTSHTRNLCIVGDDDQSIYSWRGAEPAFIMQFNQYFPDAIVYKLEQNYRCTGNIVAAASQLIGHNLKRAPKTLWTNTSSGEKIHTRQCSDAFDEATYICNTIAKKMDLQTNYSEFAILYRTNAQSRSLEDELRRRMLPYIIYGSVRFYERAEIKILLAYLRLVINPADDAAFQKTIGCPKRGFGEKAMLTLKELGIQNNLSLMATTHRIAQNTLNFSQSRGISALKSISLLFLDIEQFLYNGGKASHALQKITSSIEFGSYLRIQYPEDHDERQLNTLELQNAILEFESSNPELTPLPLLTQFLEQAALTVEPTHNNVKSGAADAITLMTIHSSKGLEFPTVFIAGLEEGVLPHMNSLESAASIEEERRLMYVAMTRARARLYLTSIRCNRYRSDMPAIESRFLSEIPFGLMESDTPTPNRSHSLTQSTGWSSNRTRTQYPSHDFDPQSDPVYEECSWFKGQRVNHKTFGQGVVQTIEQGAMGTKLEIRFPSVGLKKILESFVSPE